MNEQKNPAAVSLGRLGGSAKTSAQAEASRKNGRLGGRPRKKVLVKGDKKAAQRVLAVDRVET
jgi:hypothetical protein